MPKPTAVQLATLARKLGRKPTAVEVMKAFRGTKPPGWKPKTEATPSVVTPTAAQVNQMLSRPLPGRYVEGMPGPKSFKVKPKKR